MKLLFNPAEINNTPTYKNTNNNVFFSDREHEYKIINKLPIELPINLSILDASFEKLVFRLKEMQRLVDNEFTSDKIIFGCADHEIIYEVSDPYHIVYPVIQRANNNIGYTLNHVLYDSFDILSKINLKDLREPVEGKSNLLDIIHIKAHTTIPYHIHRPFSNGESEKIAPALDMVECMIVLNGNVKFYTSTHPRNPVVEKYEGILPKHKIIAFNPEILHTGVALTDDVYILYLRFNGMRFTDFLKKDKY